MATLLTQMIFVTASSAQQGLPQLQHTERERLQHSVQLAQCFTLHCSFPCAVQALPAVGGNGVHRPTLQAQVQHCNKHMHLLGMHWMLTMLQLLNLQQPLVYVSIIARSLAPRRHAGVVLYASADQQATTDKRRDAGDACPAAAADAGGRPKH